MKNHHIKKLTLRRNLNLFEAIACGVGIIVGAGIYVLLGPASGLAGNAVWLSFLISALLAMFTGLSYAELNSMFPKDGSEYTYIENTFNKKLAFLVGYVILLGGAISAATVSLDFAGYLNSLINHNLIISASILLICVTLINMLGTKDSSHLNIILTTIQVAALIFLVIASLKYFGSVNYFQNPNGFKGIFQGASLIFFAYIGFESLVKLSEETKNPKKTIPIALIVSLIIATTLYILVSLSAVSVLGYEQLSQSKAPLSDVMSKALGSDYSLFIAIVALLTTATTVLLQILVTSRILYGIGEDNKSLNFLTTLSKKRRTPYLALLIALSISLLFVFIGNIETVASITNFTIFLTFFFVNLSLIILRYKKPNIKRKFRVPLNIKNFPITALFGLISSLVFIANLQFKIVLGGLSLVIIGIILESILNKKIKSGFGISKSKVNFNKKNKFKGQLEK